MKTCWGSENPESAENQQERLIYLGWVVGFVDGEGCFSIGFVRQPDRAGRRGYRAGYQVSHRFVVSQGERSRECLEELKEFFGAGRIAENPRGDDHREHMCQFIVGRRDDLLHIVIPFFERHPLRTSKQEDFQKFSCCMDMVARKQHLSPEGLIEIAKVAETMNRQTPRRDLIRILRGHTPDTPDTG